MSLIIFALGLVGAVFFLWWLFIETEGVYLGSRTVIALYDLYAKRYDRIKQFDERADFLLLGEPLIERLRPLDNPLILDVATGTARLPLILARNARFKGHVIGLDKSRRMLAVAAAKIAAEHFEDFISLMRHDAMNLPFPDDAFDAVASLESLEFLPDPEAALGEMARVLRPGGWLLTTIRIDTRWMPTRTSSAAQMKRVLESQGMCEFEIETWQEDYSKVWARKLGESLPISACYQKDILRTAGQIAINRTSLL